MRHLPPLLLALASSACSTVTTVLHQPVPARNLQRYAVAADSLGEASLAALAAQGLRVELDTLAGNSRMILARRSVGIVVAPDDTEWGAGKVGGFVLGSGAGFALCAAAGSLVRTRVWSDLTPTR